MPARPADDQLVAGRYVWRERLGRGGFGEVWRAHDTLLQRDVAVKAIELPPVLDDEEQARVRRKVLHEARAAARLNHPGLVTVFDVIEEDGRPLIVMELVKAPTLAQLVARDGPLPDERAASIGLSVLDALDAAHAAGIVHRDVKPANVMVSESGHVQLGDFGIASIIDDPKVTSSGSVAGSPAYMAPEQAASRPTSAATDLWGLAATLWFAVQGEPPFAENGTLATMAAVVNEDPRPMRRDTALAPLLRALLVKDPAERPSTADVRRRLLRISEGEPAADATSSFEFVPPTPPADGSAATETAAAPDPEPEPSFEAEPPPRPEPAPAPVRPAPVRPAPVRPAPVRSAPAAPRRRWSGTGVAVVVVLALIVALTVALVAGQDDDSSTTSPTTNPGRAAEPAATVPGDWVNYRDPSTGFAISRPPDWTVERRGTLTDFNDPETGAYLRVDHRQPPGPSAEGAWYEFEPRFAAQNANYRRIQITPTQYQGYPAAIWEYTYSGRGSQLRAVNLGFITGDYGFALNFVAPTEDWERFQSVFEAFKASFKAPGA